MATKCCESCKNGVFNFLGAMVYCKVGSDGCGLSMKKYEPIRGEGEK